MPPEGRQESESPVYALATAARKRSLLRRGVDVPSRLPTFARASEKASERTCSGLYSDFDTERIPRPMGQGILLTLPRLEDTRRIPGRERRSPLLKIKLVVSSFCQSIRIANFWRITSALYKPPDASTSPPDALHRLPDLPDLQACPYHVARPQTHCRPFPRHLQSQSNRRHPRPRPYW